MKKYYYSDGKQQIGPLSKEELQSKGITKETLVWYEGLTEWTKAGDAEELADLFPNTPTPPPLPEEKTTTPPPIPQTDSLAEETGNKAAAHEIKESKNTKKTIKIIRIIIGVILVSIIAFVVYENIDAANRRDNINRIENQEKNHPERYLELKNISVNGNSLMGVIKNNAKYVAYKEVYIKVSYYDSSGVVLQSDKYIVDVKDGLLLGGFSSQFEINLREVQGIKNRLKVEKRDIEVVGAKYF